MSFINRVKYIPFLCWYVPYTCWTRDSYYLEQPISPWPTCCISFCRPYPSCSRSADIWTEPTDILPGVAALAVNQTWPIRPCGAASPWRSPSLFSSSYLDHSWKSLNCWNPSHFVADASICQSRDWRKHDKWCTVWSKKSGTLLVFGFPALSDAL